MKWDIVQLPKELGGLGVGNILFKNLCLLFKWWWRYSESDSSLWKRIVQSVHDVLSSKASSEVFNNVKDGLWSQLMSSDSETTKVRSIVEEGMVLNVGRGNTIMFWVDRWCEVGPLKYEFPRLFRLSSQQLCFINEMGTWREREWVWIFYWN